jgi:hypothetical protein
MVHHVYVVACLTGGATTGIWFDDPPEGIMGWAAACSCTWLGPVTSADEVAMPPTREQEGALLDEADDHIRIVTAAWEARKREMPEL